MTIIDRLRRSEPEEDEESTPFSQLYGALELERLAEDMEGRPESPDAYRAQADSYINQIDPMLTKRIRETPELTHWELALSNMNRTTYMSIAEARMEEIRLNFLIRIDKARHYGDQKIQALLGQLEFVVMNVVRDARHGHRAKHVRETHKRITVGTAEPQKKRRTWW